VPAAAAKAPEVAAVPTEPLPDFSGVWIKVGLLDVTPPAAAHSKKHLRTCSTRVRRHGSDGRPAERRVTVV